VSWELAILISGMGAEVILIFLLNRARVFQTLPAFFIYLCWSLFSDGFLYYVRVSFPQNFFNFYVAQLIIDSIMIFALLVEVAWSVLRPIRSSLPKHSWVGIALLVAVGAAILWPIAGLATPENMSLGSRNLFLLLQTTAILRAVFFLALAAFSRLLSIGWRDRELQIATGLGFFSIISLAVTIIHTHQAVGPPDGQWGVLYHWLDRVVAFSYLGALAYWCVAFATRTVERREFTPQMKSMLLAVAGTARHTRIDLEDSTKSGR
jgi:hypothetical protein